MGYKNNNIYFQLMLRGLNEIVIHRLSDSQGTRWYRVASGRGSGRQMQKREEGLLLTIYLFVISCFVLIM